MIDPLIRLVYLFILISYLQSCGQSTPASEEKKNKTDSLASLIHFDSSTTDSVKQLILERIDRRYLQGKFDPSSDDRFIQIPLSYCDKEMYMRKEALASFEAMHRHAIKDGISFRIVSATRPFSIQKAIWEAKWRGKRKVDGVLLDPNVTDSLGRALKILRWSSMPGTSRHHWGTDIDLNNLEPSYWEEGQGKKEYDWLTEHAKTYGFCQVYSTMDKNRPNGYQEEKWHWSYVPIASSLTQAYADSVANTDLKGFDGHTTAVRIDMVKKYVLGINSECF